MKQAPTCEKCARAENDRLFSQFDMRCYGCRVRNVSRLPKYLRDSAYTLIEDQEERAKFISAVNKERRRNQPAPPAA
mgnify:CR=1 FL=1